MKKNWIWIYKNLDLSIEDWEEKLARFEKNGIYGINLLADTDFIKKIIPLKNKYNLKLNTWVFTLLVHKDEYILKNHPNWAAVSRSGDSSFEKSPYVDYYKWLCPNQAKDYLIKKFEQYTKIKDLDGIHFDYIRFCDVILPESLQPKYGINQTSEFPEYDFCYCDKCCELFEKKTGINPKNIEFPAKDKNWLQFRYNSITNLINALSKEFKRTDFDISAAVFPGPSTAKKLVRQEWNKWNLDNFFPMNYNYFYNKNIDWIGKMVHEESSNIKKQQQLFSGIYLPEMNIQDFEKAVRISFENNADGIALFSDNDFKKEHFKILLRLSKNS